MMHTDLSARLGIGGPPNAGNSDSRFLPELAEYCNRHNGYGQPLQPMNT